MNSIDYVTNQTGVNDFSTFLKDVTLNERQSSTLLAKRIATMLESSDSLDESIVKSLQRITTSDDDVVSSLWNEVRYFNPDILGPLFKMTLMPIETQAPTSLTVGGLTLLKADSPLIIGGYASVEMIDREKHFIPLSVLTNAFSGFMVDERYRNIQFAHGNVQVGVVLAEWTSPTTGKVYKSEVDDRGLYVVAELRTDHTVAKFVVDKIGTNELTAFSISGMGKQFSDHVGPQGMQYKQVDQLELYEITICVPENTPIVTLIGVKFIQNIEVGEEVLTHKGRFRKVLRTMHRPVAEELVVLHLSTRKFGRAKIRMTTEHPVLVIRDDEEVWVRAKSVVEGDDLREVGCLECGSRETQGQLYCFAHLEKRVGCATCGAILDLDSKEVRWEGRRKFCNRDCYNEIGNTGLKLPTVSAKKKGRPGRHYLMSEVGKLLRRQHMQSNEDFARRASERMTARIMNGAWPRPNWQEYDSTKAGRLKLKSRPEVEFARKLDADVDVIGFENEAIRIPYIWEGRWHSTIPDFLVKYESGFKEIVEVKPRWAIEHYPQVRAKLLSVEEFARTHSLGFRLWDGSLFYSLREVAKVESH